MVRRLSYDHLRPDPISKAFVAEIKHDPLRVLRVLREVMPVYVGHCLEAIRRDPIDFSEVEEQPQADSQRFVSRKVQAIYEAYRGQQD